MARDFTPENAPHGSAAVLCVRVELQCIRVSQQPSETVIKDNQPRQRYMTL